MRCIPKSLLHGIMSGIVVEGCIEKLVKMLVGTRAHSVTTNSKLGDLAI